MEKEMVFPTEEEYFKEKAYLKMEKEIEEKEIMQQIFEQEMMSPKTAKIVLGKGRKKGKFVSYGKVIIWRPRFSSK